MLKNKEYIGIWDDRDQNNVESPLGGILEDKNHDLFVFIKILNDKTLKDTKIKIFKTQLEELGLYPEYTYSTSNLKEKLADKLSRFVFIFNLNNGLSSEDKYVINVEKRL